MEVLNPTRIIPLYIIAKLITTDVIHNKIEVKKFIDPILTYNNFAIAKHYHYSIDFDSEVFNIFKTIKIQRAEPYKYYKKYYRAVCVLENYKIHKFIPRGNKRP